MRFKKGDCCHGAASRGFAPALQRLFFFVAAMLVCTAALGDEVTFTCGSSNLSSGTDKSLESNGVKITFSSILGVSTSSGGYVTCKQNTTLTVSSDNTISGIVVNYQRDNGVSDVTSDPGTITNSGKQSSWTGSAKSVVFTFAGSKDVRVSSIVVTYTSLPVPILSFANTDVVTGIVGNVIDGKTVTSATVDGTEVTGLEYSYSSSDESIVTVDASTGKLTLVAEGEATITATSKATAEYASGSASYTVKVSPLPAPILSFSSASVQIKDDATSITTPKLTFDANSTAATNDMVKYSIEPGPTGITINETDGKVTLPETGLTIGTATVTASIPADTDGSYAAASASYTIYVVSSQTTYFSELLTEGQKLTADDLTQEVKDKDEAGKLLLTVTLGDGEDVANWKPASKDSGLEKGFSGAKGSFDYSCWGDKDGKDEGKITGYNADGSVKYDAPAMYKAGAGNDQFDLPISGTFFRFEPEVDGTVYMLSRQNGAPQIDDNVPDYSRLRKRGGFVVDETGTALKLSSYYNSGDHPMMVAVKEDGSIVTDFSTITSDDGVKAYVVPDTKFGDEFDFYTKDKINGATGTDDNKTSSVENLKFYKAILKNKGIITADTDPIKGKDAFIIYDQNDGFMLLTKGNICYEFPVKAGKTYFVTAYQTKLSFSGYSFIPAKSQPEATDITLDEGELNGSNVNSDVIVEANNGKLCNVTVNRKLEKGVWYTMVLPFHVGETQTKKVFGDNVMIVHFNDYNADANDINLVKHKYQMIMPGVPFMIRQTDRESLSNFTFNNVILSSTDVTPFKDRVSDSGYNFTGTYEPATISAGNNYFVSKNVNDQTDTKSYFVKCTKDQPIRALRAWLTTDGTGTSSNLNIKVDGEDLEGGAATEIINAMMGETTAVSGNVYNMQGQLVRQGTTMLNGLGKGVYIVNGKKVIVK